MARPILPALLCAFLVAGLAAGSATASRFLLASVPGKNTVECDASTESDGKIQATLQYNGRSVTKTFATCNFDKDVSIAKYLEVCGITDCSGAEVEVKGTGIDLSVDGSNPFCTPCTNLDSAKPNAATIACGAAIETCKFLDDLWDDIKHWAEDAFKAIEKCVEDPSKCF
mmetsp:Transcript_4579/g.12752  ORF Transcript_4579/g.12752 Transcript_4579/m.12752 type:complete len:170 (-) Transcript_4579:92-601(-)